MFRSTHASNIRRDEDGCGAQLIVGSRIRKARNNVSLVPQRLRKNQFSDADSAQGFRGLESLDRRRRYRLGSSPMPRRLHAIIRKPGFRRRSGNFARPSEPMATLSRTHIKRRLDPGGGVWWRHADQPPPNAPLAGQMDSAIAKRPARRPRIPTPAYRARVACPTIDPDGKIPTACRSALLYSEDAARRRCLWLSGVQLDLRRIHRPTMGSEMTAAAAGTIGKVAATPWRCCLFGLSHGRFISATDHHAAVVDQHPPSISQLFRKDADGKFIGVSAKTCAC